MSFHLAGPRRHTAVAVAVRPVGREAMSRHLLLLLAALLLGGTLARAQAPAAGAASTMTLKVGGKKLLAVTNAVRVAVSDPDVADIRVANAGSVEVTGRNAGTTELSVWKEGGEQVKFVITVSR